MQTYIDEYKYERHWKDYMGNVKKIIHNNGDVYKENWVNNKVEGYNAYNNSDSI